MKPFNDVRSGDVTGRASSSASEFADTLTPITRLEQILAKQRAILSLLEQLSRNMVDIRRHLEILDARKLFPIPEPEVEQLPTADASVQNVRVAPINNPSLKRDEVAKLFPRHKEAQDRIFRLVHGTRSTRSGILALMVAQVPEVKGHVGYGSFKKLARRDRVLAYFHEEHQAWRPFVSGAVVEKVLEGLDAVEKLYR